MEIATQLNISPEASFVCVPDFNQGYDLLMVWTKEDSTADMIEYAPTSTLTIVHIAAIEVKDRRFTESVEWSEKMDPTLLDTMAAKNISTKV